MANQCGDFSRFVFFKQKTAYEMRISDWRSDVCSSDLVIDIAGGTPGPTTEAVLPEHLPQPTSIPLRSARLARVLGLEVADAEVERILRALGLGVEANADGWTVTAPTRRFDLAIEEDLVERSEEHTSELQSLMRISYA